MLTALEAELDEHLGYEHGDREGKTGTGQVNGAEPDPSRDGSHRARPAQTDWASRSTLTLTFGHPSRSLITRAAGPWCFCSPCVDSYGRGSNRLPKTTHHLKWFDTHFAIPKTTLRAPPAHQQG